MNLSETVAANTPPPAEDKLEQLRDAVRRMRDLEVEVSSLEERAKERRAAILKMKHETLVEMFQQLKLNHLGLEPEGNLPAYDASLEPYYKASIAADWPPERQAAAFNWLEKHGHGDLIKTMVVVEMGRGERALAKKVTKALDRLGVSYSTRLGVPWNTLTSWLKERIEKHKETPPLETLGAQAGFIVKLKEKK